MDTVAAGQGLHLAVVRKKPHSGRLFARHHGFEKFVHGKTGALQHLRRVLVTRMGGLHKLVDGRFHGAHHQRSFTHAHHFQRAGGRVQVLAGDAQGHRVQRRSVGGARLRHVVCKKLDGFDCAVE